MVWTDEAVETLRMLADRGLSASAIAAALGAESRNVVIGKASRIGVKLNGIGGRASPIAAPGAEMVRRAPRSPFASRAVARRPAAGAVSVRPNARMWAGAEVGEMRRLRLDEMRDIACRWPLGDPQSSDFAYCGLAPAEGRSYCAGHCRIAYRPPGDRSCRQPWA